LTPTKNNFSVLIEEIECFAIELRIALGKSYSNSYEHESYIKVRMEETFYYPVIRGRRTKKNGQKFYLFIIRDKYSQNCFSKNENNNYLGTEGVCDSLGIRY